MSEPHDTLQAIAEFAEATGMTIESLDIDPVRENITINVEPSSWLAEGETLKRVTTHWGKAYWWIERIGKPLRMIPSPLNDQPPEVLLELAMKMRGIEPPKAEASDLPPEPFVESCEEG